MNVFLTGGTGFIGRHLAARLSEEGHRVRCLVRSLEKASWMRDYPGLEPVPGDILDGASWRPWIGRSELVYHLAGCTAALRREEYFSVNGHGTGNIAEAASLSTAEGPKVVYLSSLSVAGPHTSSGPAAEVEDPRPISSYGESKLLGEKMLRHHCRRTPWTILRAPAVYGPFDRDLGLYFRMAAKGCIPNIAGGKIELSLIHVEDLTEALLLAGFTPASDAEIFNVSDGNTYTGVEIARTLQEILGKGLILPIPGVIMKMAGLCGDFSTWARGSPAILDSRKAKEATQKGWVCRIDKIKSRLNYSPRIGLKEGFSSTYGWYRSEGWI